MSNPIKYSEFFNDDGAIDALLKKLQDVEKVYKRLSKQVGNSFEDMAQKAKGFDATTEDGRKEIEKLEKQIEDLIRANKALGGTEEDLNEKKKQALKLAKEEQKLIKKRNELTDEQSKKNAELKIEIQQLNKEIKEQAKENLGLTNEYDRQSKTLIKLRKEYKGLAAAGKENTDQAKKLLAEVQELDGKLKAIDKSVGQSQRNVGNYAEAFDEAAASGGAFAESMAASVDKSGVLGEVVGKLTTLIGFFTAAQNKLNKEKEEETIVTEANTASTLRNTRSKRALGRASLIASRGVKVLNRSLKAGVIGAIIIAISGLVAGFTKMQAGLDQITGLVNQVKAVFDTLVPTLFKAGKAIVTLGFSALRGLYTVIESVVDAVSGLIKAFENFSTKDLFTAAGRKKLAESLKKPFEDVQGNINDFINTTIKAITDLGEVISDLPSIADQIKEAIAAADKLTEMTAKYEAQIIKLREEQAKLTKESEKLEEIEGDNTRSFEERRKAIVASAEAQRKAAEIGVQIARKELELVAEEQKVRKKANELELKRTIERINANSKLTAEAKKKEIDAAKKANASLREDDKSLSEARIALNDAIVEGQIKSIALLRVENQLYQDEREKTLDIVIDGFDKQKSLLEAQINDEENSFAKRRELIVKLRNLQIEARKNESKIIQDLLNNDLETRKKTAKIEGKSQEFINGLKVKQINLEELLAEKSSIGLQEKIRSLGLSEIGETRLLEIVKENLQITKDLTDAEKQLNKQRAEFLKSNIQSTEDLNASLIENSEQRAQKELDITFQRQLKEIEGELKKAEKDEELTKALLDKKFALEKDYIEKSKQIKLDGLRDANEKELKQLEIDLLGQNKKQEEIQEKLRDQKIKDLEELTAAQKEINEKNIDDELELARLKAQKEKDIEAKKQKELNEIRDLAAQAAFDAFQKQIEEELKLIEKRSAAQEKQIEKQAELAKEGAANTLAFEEAELAKLEAKRQDLERKQIQLEKVKALYAAYSNRASAGDDNALANTLRDFAIIQGIEASLKAFGEGTGDFGDVSDALRADQNGTKGNHGIYNGILRGDSHKAKSGGFPIMVEGDEGIWKGSTMQKFGKDNFVNLTKAIDSGMLGKNFMGGHASIIPAPVGININLGSLERKMDDLQRAIINKPVQEVNVENIAKSYLDVIETKTTGNKKQINRFRIPKSRF